MTGPLPTTDSQLIELDVGSWVYSLSFSSNGEYIVNGDANGVGVWRTKDGKQLARMQSSSTVLCLAISGNDEWIAAGTYWGDVLVWDAATYELVFEYKENFTSIRAVDFSPDSTRLISASLEGSTIVWDVRTWKPIRTLCEGRSTRTAKFSPQGDRVATATEESVRVWNSDDGRLLVEIRVQVTPCYNRGLVWFTDHCLLVVATSTITKFDAYTGTVITEWAVPDSSHRSCIALPKHGELIAYSTGRTVSFLDASTHAHLILIQHTQDINSIAFSSDNQFLTMGGQDAKIAIQSLPRIMASIPSSLLHSTLQEPSVVIDDPVLELWENDQLENAEHLLTTAITASQNPTHHVFVSRALVRARLQKWDAALEDSRRAIDIDPSVMAFMAKSVAHVGKHEKDMAYRTCDIAIERFHSSHVTFLLVVKAIIIFMTGDYPDAVSRLDDLIAMVPPNSLCYTVQAYMYFLLGNSQMERRAYEQSIRSFEHARAQIRNYRDPALFAISLLSGWKFDNLDVTIRQHLCEALHAAGRIDDSTESLLEMVNTLQKEVYTNGDNIKWIVDFTYRCLSTPKDKGCVTTEAVGREREAMQHGLLNSPTTVRLLKEWTSVSLMTRSWKDILATATELLVPSSSVCRALCERLETLERTMDASQCYRKSVDELGEAHADDEQVKWALDFKSRCLEKLELLGDSATSAGGHYDAISHYSEALALGPDTFHQLYIKRSKAHLSAGSWKDALNDANKAVELDPASPLGYERKHGALHKGGDYENAVYALEDMFSRMSQSSDPEILEYQRQYVTPGETKIVIRDAVQDAIRDSPRVLINTISGRLLDKSAQAAAFESLPLFNKLISSTTMHIDHANIVHHVAQYYRYAMFSHKWQGNEPLFENVTRMVVYDLDESATHNKLKSFCNAVRNAGLTWAWSDTCCINKADHFVLQEALVSMFKWYQNSALTLVLLCGVHSPSLRGDLIRSIWNSRAWTLQEYHASKVVLFYNEDWTLYRDLDIPNHKESPEVLSEMEEATGISAQALSALRPGLDDIRTKLCLASTRQTTIEEDAAYSMMGIFTTSLPVLYGEWDQALGRLLAQLLTSSGDANILAWTGKSGTFNSCLPAKIAVFKEMSTSYIPSSIPGTETDTIITRLHATSPDHNSIIRLYHRLDQLPLPMFMGQRMKLPCIFSQLGAVSASQTRSERVFRAKTASLGMVEIRTDADLTRFRALYLVHPWIDFLLDRRSAGSPVEPIPERRLSSSSSIPEVPLSPSVSSGSSTGAKSRKARFSSRLGLPFGGGPSSSSQRLHDTAETPRSALVLRVGEKAKQMRDFRMLARLGQPFGALLLTPNPGNVMAYRRVAAESLVTVRIEDVTTLVLEKVINSVGVLDVL